VPFVSKKQKKKSKYRKKYKKKKVIKVNSEIHALQRDFFFSGHKLTVTSLSNFSFFSFSLSPKNIKKIP
jgi:hypothetical protein